MEEDLLAASLDHGSGAPTSDYARMKSLVPEANENDSISSVNTNATTMTTQSMRLRLLKQRSVGAPNGDNKKSPSIPLVSSMKQRMHLDKAQAAFRTNVQLSMRIALGVLLAGVAQTHAPANNSGKEWLFLPDHYYLGGLTYAAAMVIYAGARNVGGAIEQMWQIDTGVAIALLYNFVIFACIPMTQADLIHVQVELRGRSYDISVRDLAVVLPLLLLFTFLMFIAPMQANVKKFAVSTNLYFTLTIVNPMNPIIPTQRKDLGDGLFGTKNLITNFAIYSLVGAVGTTIALATMVLPYPILATQQLMGHMKDAPHDIREILNLIVDSYCFRAKDIKEMDFFRLRLDRLLSNAQERLTEMEGLVDNCWWEELIGAGVWFNFNKMMAKQFVKLYARLLKDVHAMKFAIESETCHWTHVVLMKKLQKRIYVLQTEMNDLLEDISRKVLQADTSMPSSRFNHLEIQLERLMSKYTRLYGEMAASEVHSAADVGKTMPLNMFLYSFHALAHTLFEFEQQFNHKNFTPQYRIRNFVKVAWRSFYQKSNYPRQLVFFSFRTTLAVFIGVGFSTFVFAFSSTVPTAIAMVAQCHIGGTYGNTANRLTGLVAGTVLPSIFNFFLCKISNDIAYNALNNLVLFTWTVGSMYVYFSGTYLRMAGMVSGYMAASVLLEHSCRSVDAPIGTLTYSPLTENALGILILLLVELTLQPKSANGLLRENIQDLLKQYRVGFRQIFRHNLASEQLQGLNESGLVHLHRLTETEIKALRKNLSVTFPQLLAQQTKLLHDASLEPTLWRPEFSVAKYSQVLNACQTIMTHLCILLDLVEWHDKRQNNGIDTRLHRPRTSTLNQECRDAIIAAGNDPDAPSRVSLPFNAHQQWLNSQDAFETSVEDTLETLTQLFSKDFSYVNGEETAIFMQMKEAFRIADVHRRGEVDASELVLFLEQLLPYAAIGNVQVDQYVGEFMQMVDKNHDGKISFAEFMKALNEGFRMELEIYETTTTVVTRTSSDRCIEIKSEPSEIVAAQLATTEIESASSLGPHELVTPLSTTVHPAVIEDGKETPLLRGASLSDPRTSSVHRRRTSIEGSAEALLNVESFTIKQAAATLKRSYAEHFTRQYNREHYVPMEDFIVMSCLISSCEKIASTLSQLNALAAT
ncbi:hypothetical protein FI667_g13207, partial [Globisporangium splendens]